MVDSQITALTPAPAALQGTITVVEDVSAATDSAFRRHLEQIVTEMRRQPASRPPATENPWLREFWAWIDPNNTLCNSSTCDLSTFQVDSKVSINMGKRLY